MEEKIFTLSAFAGLLDKAKEWKLRAEAAEAATERWEDAYWMKSGAITEHDGTVEHCQLCQMVKEADSMVSSLRRK